MNSAGSYIQIWDDFEKLEQNIASVLMENKNLFKLLKDSANDPLERGIEDEDIEDMLTEYDDNGQLNPNCRVFFEPFIETALTSRVSNVRIYPVQVNPENVYVGDLYIQIDIIVHQSISKIKDGRRRNRILSEIIKSLNGSDIKLAQTLRLVDKPITLRQFKDEYWGYSILLKSGVAMR